MNNAKEAATNAMDSVTDEEAISRRALVDQYLVWARSHRDEIQRIMQEEEEPALKQVHQAYKDYEATKRLIERNREAAKIMALRKEEILADERALTQNHAEETA